MGSFWGGAAPDAGVGIAALTFGAEEMGLVPLAGAFVTGALSGEIFFVAGGFAAMAVDGGNGALALVFVRTASGGVIRSMVFGVDAGHATGFVNAGAAGRGVFSRGLAIFAAGTGFFLSNVASPRWI